jgi:Holliday junction resolvase
MRKRGKVDQNQAEIVDALRKAGAEVYITSNMGGGFPDLLVMYRSTLLLIECKSKGGRMTSDEQAFYNKWQDCTVVVYSVEEALEAIGRLWYV